jgi:hypothetical protein
MGISNPFMKENRKLCCPNDSCDLYIIYGFQQVWEVVVYPFSKVFPCCDPYDPQVVVCQEPEGLSHVPLPDCPQEPVYTPHFTSLTTQE